MALPLLRDRLGEGGFVLSAWSSLADPLVHETLARAPFDALTFDMQHGLGDLRSVEAGIARAVFLGKPALVRLPVEDRAMASRVLDFGASGVIMPMIEGESDARAFVDAVKYPPLGRRSFGPTRAVELHGFAAATDYTAAANRETLAFAMVETRTALDSLADILAIDGLDGVFVGPSDLSIALSETGKLDPTGPLARAAIAEISQRTAAAGKIAAIYAGSAIEARDYRPLGYRLVCVSSAVAMLRRAAAETVATVMAP